MEAIFFKLLNMSITASWLALAIIVLRLLLKKAPKAITVVMWALAGIRLICPFSFESTLSLIPSAETIPTNIIYSDAPTIQSGIPALNGDVNPIISKSLTPAVGDSVNPMQIVTFIASVIWIAGMIAMLLYTVISYLRIHRKVREAAPLQDNIWLCDRIATPFIFGVIRPRIYLPSDMKEQDMEYVIAHEKAHLKRHDHWWKPLGFLLLTVYWFNPVLWIAYILLCRDIELACDEKVIKDMGTEIKKPYSDALINCSVPRKMISACPLAFGEVGVKGRIQSVLSYKKPAFWIIIAAVVACIALSVGFLTNPAGIKLTSLNDSGNYSKLFDEVQEITAMSGENQFTTTDGETINNIVSVLQEVKIRKTPISQNRSDARDMANRITINNSQTLCFNENYTELWIYNGVKPTLSYKVLNPAIVKSAFTTMGSDRINSSLLVKEKGSDVEGVFISIKWAELDIGKPYIEVEWKNETNAEYIYGESFNIFYNDNGKLTSCATTGLYFREIGISLLPNDSNTETYYISDFDLSKSGEYRFVVGYEGQQLWIDFEIGTSGILSVGGVSRLEGINY